MLQKELLTVREMSEFLGVSRRTGYRLIGRGDIPYYHDVGGIKIKRTDLESWLRYGKVMASLSRRQLRQSVTESLNPLGGGVILGSAAEKGCLLFGRVYKRATCKHWTIDYLDYRMIQENGKPKRQQEVIRGASTKQDALRALREKEKEVIGTDEIEGESITFRDFAEIYMNTYAKKKRSWKSDRKYLDSQLIPFFGKMYLFQMKPKHVQQFINKRLKDGVQENTVNRHLQVLRKMMNFAIDNDYQIAKNPVRSHHLFSEKEFVRDRVLSYAEEEKLLEASAAHLKPIIRYALMTGCRLQEILNLKITDLDFEEDVITIRPEVNKTGKLDVIPMTPKTKELLTQLVRENQGRTENVFNYYDNIQKRLRPIQEIKVAFSNARRRARIEGLQFRDLRRTFGTRLHERGIDPLIIQRLLRHSSFKISEQVYIKSSVKMMKEELKKLDEKTAVKVPNFGKSCDNFVTFSEGKPVFPQGMMN